ncbi:hypothetical protein KIN20_033350 [Parelaphostrongylus tenuis]|uniref:Protein kinase domain-containing protein n=1 Tax=Parelaphostrongylus tenuis TaxID=148309 RepID=A0AAD5RA59_PARTN|nr:hypothetical protein KIN20_033350 [Parelaphostrongylus tenuis]
MGAGIQCLEACEDLHKCGFIHRDLKPSNYACGLGDQKRVVYLLDFGLARKIINVKGELKAPRESVLIKGTLRFISMACHKRIELGPKDDCESWFYLILDITYAGGLPWKLIDEKDEVLKKKEKMRSEKRDAILGALSCKEELSKMIDYIDTLKYYDHVDYEYIYKLAEQGAKSAGGDINDLYDWEKAVGPSVTTTAEETVKQSN